MTSTKQGAKDLERGRLPGPAYRYIRASDHLPTYAQMEKDPLCPVKLFGGPATWWLAAYDPEERIAYGVTQLQEREAGDFSMAEVVDLRIPPFGLPVERDLDYVPQRLSEILVRGLYARLAREYEKEPFVPDHGGGLPGDRYELLILGFFGSIGASLDKKRTKISTVDRKRERNRHDYDFRRLYNMSKTKEQIIAEEIVAAHACLMGFPLTNTQRLQLETFVRRIIAVVALEATDSRLIEGDDEEEIRGR